MKPTIFVSIASYRDAELIPTLHDLLDKSSREFSLSVAVCWQSEEDIAVFLQAGFKLREKKRFGKYKLFICQYADAIIKIIILHYFHSQGACWARQQCEKLYKNEKYFLQIDSHCRFTENWDREMVALLEQLKAESKKPLISSYPPGYEPGKEDEKANFCYRLAIKGFTKEGIPEQIAVCFQENSPARGSYLAAGFIFAQGSFVKEVPNDPKVFFEGEEISMAVRAFTHGYDVWHPHKILLWHFYGRSESSRIWSDHDEKAKSSGSVTQAWHERDKTSKKRVRMILGIEEKDDASLGKYRKGSVRTLEEFEETTGVDFKNRLALPEVINGQQIAWTPLPREKSWRSRLNTKKQKNVFVSQSELGIPWAEVQTLHIGVYSSNNDLLYKKMLPKEDINKVLVREKLHLLLTLSFAAMLTPSVIRFSPYDENEGWGKVVEKTW